ncbi:MAG TPA: DMT family transporter [Candidatus Dormibacteraeota bacterium]|nr:DMT family transporter [Candidatus Dormibacteraeota bacterium]
MSTSLALLAAALLGSSDFLGGLASRRARSVLVTVVGQAVGFPVVLLDLLALPGRPGGEAVLWGALSGLAGGIGMVLFYRTMSRAAMSVVSAVAAFSEGGLPLVAGVVLLGERPSSLGWAGLVIGLAGVPLLCWSRSDAGPIRSSRALRSVLLGLAAGGLFGLSLILLARSPADSGQWPVLASRVATLAVAGAILLTSTGGTRIEGVPLRLAVLAGVLQAGASIAYLVAVRLGSLAAVAVLQAMYPAATIALSTLLLGERLRRAQMVGVTMVVIAVLLIALR